MYELKDIPVLLDRIVEFHDNSGDIPQHDAVAQARDLGDVLSAKGDFDRAVEEGFTQAVNKTGMKLLDLLKKYYAKWVE